MADGSLTDDQVHEWLQQIVDGRETIVGGKKTYSGSWVSLHFDSPVLGGTEKNEISGGGYVRNRVPWSQPNNRSIWSLADAKFTGLTQTKVVYFGIWDAAYRGMLRAYAELPDPAVIMNGKGYILHAGELAVSLG